MKLLNPKNLILKRCLLLLFVLFLSGCENSTSNNNKININSEGFSFQYNGNVQLEKVLLQKSDTSDIIDIYQEVGSETTYKDSLIIAKGFNPGNGINTVVQDNLNILENQGVKIENLKKTQLKINKDNTNYNAVLTEYKIANGLIKEVPILYISQLFIAKDSDYLVYSFTTESEQQQSHISKMLKNFK